LPVYSTFWCPWRVKTVCTGIFNRKNRLLLLLLQVTSPIALCRYSTTDKYARKSGELPSKFLNEISALPAIILAGLNNNGYEFAQLIVNELKTIAPASTDITLTRIRLNPANPVEYDPCIELPAEALREKPVIIVDDVANTGRTVFYAVQPLLSVIPAKVEVAVLVDRTHKSFPIKADYVGMSLATTMLDNIDVQIHEKEKWPSISYKNNCFKIIVLNLHPLT
jgi:pyrimidine operon attenuation protein/uracil phosphoribosyltransferase